MFVIKFLKILHFRKLFEIKKKQKRFSKNSLSKRNIVIKAQFERKITTTPDTLLIIN